MAGKLQACGVILAGGQSSRMGRDKALLEFEGQPLIARLADRFRDWFEQVVVVTNTPEAYSFLDLPIVGDRIPGLGPLGGLEAGLMASRFAHTFCVACDMPFINEGLVRAMVALAETYDIVVPVVNGAYEPMHAVYRRSCLPIVTRRIDERHLRLISLFDEANVRNLTENEVKLFGDPKKLLFNCNTPGEFNSAKSYNSHE